MHALWAKKISIKAKRDIDVFMAIWRDSDKKIFLNICFITIKHLHKFTVKNYFNEAMRLVHSCPA